MEHQRQESLSLRLVRPQPRHESAEPDRLLGQPVPARIGAGHVLPAAAVSGVDRLEDGVEPRGELARRRDLEADAGFADLRLHAHQALAHRGRRDEERRGDPRGVEPEHGLQHQRCAGGLVDRRVRADEEQRQPLVGKRCRRGVGPLVQHDLQIDLGGRRDAGVARAVYQAAPRGGEQPGHGVIGHAGARPRLERGEQRVAERVFRARHIAPARGEVREQPSVRDARRELGRLAGVPHILRLGRTSAAPVAADGQRAAHSSARSRSGTSMT